jgi:hypothetical protein
LSWQLLVRLVLKLWSVTYERLEDVVRLQIARVQAGRLLLLLLLLATP